MRRTDTQARTDEQVVLSFCDAGGHWVAPGATRAYEPNNLYRYCADCAREWIPLKAAGLSESELRELAGR